MPFFGVYTHVYICVWVPFIYWEPLFTISNWTCVASMPKSNLCQGQGASKGKTFIGFKWLMGHILHMGALML